MPSPGSHDIIGDRAYGNSPEAVALIGRAVAEGLMAGGVLPVIKHMPGHGRAACDSHKGLPVVEAGLDDLRRRDFAPFRALADLPMAMSAHVVFTAIDPERPATQSPAVIDGIVRGEIGFDGLLMTDDLSMHALTGPFRERAEKAFAAGIDIALHCNGDMAEMRPSARARRCSRARPPRGRRPLWPASPWLATGSTYPRPGPVSRPLSRRPPEAERLTPLPSSPARLPLPLVFAEHPP